MPSTTSGRSALEPFTSAGKTLRGPQVREQPELLAHTASRPFSGRASQPASSSHFGPPTAPSSTARLAPRHRSIDLVASAAYRARRSSSRRSAPRRTRRRVLRRRPPSRGRGAPAPSLPGRCRRPATIRSSLPLSVPGSGLGGRRRAERGGGDRRSDAPQRAQPARGARARRRRRCRGRAEPSGSRRLGLPSRPRAGVRSARSASRESGAARRDADGRRRRRGSPGPGRASTRRSTRCRCPSSRTGSRP